MRDIIVKTTPRRTTVTRAAIKAAVQEVFAEEIAARRSPGGSIKSNRVQLKPAAGAKK